MRLRGLVVTTGVCILIPAAVALAAVSGTFRGKTSEGGSVVLKIRNGELPPGAGNSYINYKAPCGQGGSLSGSTGLRGPLHKHNTFQVLNDHYSSTVSASGGGTYTARHVVNVRFKINGKTATGTFSNRAKLYTSSGKLVTTCSTGRETFSATK